MRTAHLLLLLPALLLAGCGVQTTALTLQDHLQNPLYAERYWDELVDRMANLQIQNDPILEDDALATLVEETKRDALENSQRIRTHIREGARGAFLTINEQVDGYALLLDDTLWLDSTFAAYPGPSLHLYLSEIVDPRDAVFPDASSLDMGILQNLYGAQKYVLPEEKENESYRTAVLWDTQLHRLYAFAQLAK